MHSDVKSLTDTLADHGPRSKRVLNAETDGPNPLLGRLTRFAHHQQSPAERRIKGSIISQGAKKLYNRPIFGETVKMEN